MTDPRPNLADIRTNYQVADDEVITYRPRLGGWVDIPFTDGRQMTKTEGELLDRLTRDRGLLGLRDFRDIATDAFAEGERRYPDNPRPAHVPQADERNWQGNDGHRDAFRHAYWSARLTQEYGADWAKAFTTAHEGLPGNFANREAMDLYNNSIGIQVGAANRNATPEQLANLIQQQLDQGKLVVMDRNGSLEWSDRVRVGQHGMSPEDVIGPKINTPGAVSTDNGSRASLDRPNGEQGTALAAADPNVERMRQDPMYQQVVDAMRVRGLEGDDVAANLYRGAKQAEFAQVTDIRPGDAIVDQRSGQQDRNLFVFDGTQGPLGPNYAMVSEQQARTTPEREAALAAAQPAPQQQPHVVALEQSEPRRGMTMNA